MNRNIIAATILAFGLIIAAFLNAGRYQVVRIDAGTVAVADRWTGKVEITQSPEAWLKGSSN